MKSDRWEPARAFLGRLYERHPAARDFKDPHGVGVMFAVMGRDRLNPKYHFLIEDEELRLEALRLIREIPLDVSAEPDGVLVLASAV